MARFGAIARGLRAPDAALAALVMAIVGMMIIPLPTPLLDLLIAGNITVSVLMLLVSLYAHDGLSFTAMPTVLLVSTLYRLALNVSSTRLILLQADAGDIIAAFGEFVVRGDYIVGAVVFLILTLIQFLVVARGAERVAEVGARFTLDAMPGKQLAIDADLRSGTIGPEQARMQRRVLEQESQFYGAMDGAMKFVKGDAIASIAITAINLVAGVGIGMGVRGLGLGESLHRYGLLTIGDGLVSQLPALLVSTAAGVAVTRVATPEQPSPLSQQIGAQLFGDARVLRVGALFLAALAVVPGLPTLPFLALAALTWGGSLLPRATAQPAPPDALPTSPPALAIGVPPGAPAEWRVVLADLTVALGAALRALGVPAPACTLVAEPGASRAYLRLRGRPIASAVVDDASDAIEARFSGAVRVHAAALLDLQSVQRLVDALEAREPARVRQLVPNPISLTTAQRVLKALVAEQVSVRDLGGVLEAIADAIRSGHGSSPDDGLVDAVRRSLGPTFTHALARDGVLRVHALDPMVEEALCDNLVDGPTGQRLALPPALASDIIAAIRAGVSPGSAVLTGPNLRTHVRALVAPELPTLPVLSYAEIASELQVEHGAPIAPT